MIYGYVRISTNKKSQKTDRQKLTLENYAKENEFELDDVLEERISGTVKAENRPVYNDLKNKMLREGDILLVTDLDRLGRNADDTIAETKDLKARGIKLIALDIPYMNVWDNVIDDGMYNMIVDIVITIKSHMAEQEREKIVERINQGLDVARANGKKLGRPKSELSDEFIKEYEVFNNGEYGKMTKKGFAKYLGIGRSTLYKYINIYDEEKGN